MGTEASYLFEGYATTGVDLAAIGAASKAKVAAEKKNDLAKLAADGNKATDDYIAKNEKRAARKAARKAGGGGGGGGKKPKGGGGGGKKPKKPKGGGGGGGGGKKPKKPKGGGGGGGGGKKPKKPKGGGGGGEEPKKPKEPKGGKKPKAGKADKAAAADPTLPVVIPPGTVKPQVDAGTAATGDAAAVNSKFAPLAKTDAQVAVDAAAMAAASTDECISVNAFVRGIDAKISAQIATSIPCGDFKTIVQKATDTYSNEKNSALIAAVSATLLTGVMCHGDVVTNVAELRRMIARVSCISENGTVRIDELPATESPPIPQGFVIPRLWDATWTPKWAKSKGWIQDPYYDWLMPTQQVPSAGTAASVSEPPAASASPATVQSTPEVDSDSEDVTSAEVAEAAPGAAPGIDWKSYIKWGIGAAVCLVIIIGVYMWWKSRKSGYSGEVSDTAVDAAFDNSAPPTDVSLDNQAGQENDFANNVPNTSDLMNDLPSPSRISKR